MKLEVGRMNDWKWRNTPTMFPRSMREAGIEGDFEDEPESTIWYKLIVWGCAIVAVYLWWGF